MFMFEKALVGSRRYWAWVGVLSATVLVGFFAYLHQRAAGLAVTGLSQNVPWGLYIGQFAFLVGVGASAVVVVLPYYLHNWKAFGQVTLLGEMLGMVAVFMAMLSIFVSMGQPMRVLNVLLHPHPNSLIFWDLSVLSGYVLLNAVITITVLKAEREELAPPRWLRPVIWLSIPWAVSIHTVTAFLFAGLPGRSYFMTALLAPRFLASAFTSGSALLILLIFLVRGLGLFEPNPEAVPKLARIATYFVIINLFFLGVEAFTAFYSRIPDEVSHFQFLFFGLGGNNIIARVTQISLLFALVSLTVLLTPQWRSQPRMLSLACACAFVSVWLDKGFAWIVSGFEPSPLGVITRYVPTWPEWIIELGIWALGALMLTILYKITFAVRAEREPLRRRAAALVGSAVPTPLSVQTSSALAGSAFGEAEPSHDVVLGKGKKEWRQ